MRRIGLIAAMLACAVYTVLAAWHSVVVSASQIAPSQAAWTAVDLADASPEAQLEIALKTVICDSGMSHKAGATPTGDGSGDDPSSCPVCKTLAAQHLLVLIAAEFGLLDAPSEPAVFGGRETVLTRQVWASTRSRGPPASV